MTSPYLIGPGDGDDIGGGMIRKVVKQHARGTLHIAEATVPVGMFVPPHVHTREDEIAYVLSGTLHVVIAGELVVAPAGAFVIKPRDRWHAFWNAGPEPARVLEMITPGTLDDYFAELYQLATTPELDPEERRAAINRHQARYGISFDLALGERLIETYGIQVVAMF